MSAALCSVNRTLRPPAIGGVITQSVSFLYRAIMGGMFIDIHPLVPKARNSSATDPKKGMLPSPSAQFLPLERIEPRKIQNLGQFIERIRE